MLAHIVRFALPCALLITPALAHAWTEAEVTSASARVDITSAAQAAIELTVGVRVTGGWLSRFELLDLDPDLTPASDNPSEFVGLDGRSYPAITSVATPGNVVLDFGDRHSGPRKGEYRLRFRYTSRSWRQSPVSADAPLPSGAATWSLPRWPVRLSNVYIHVLAPKGTRPVATLSGDEVSVVELADTVELSFRRVELPRTQAFSVQMQLPTPTPSTHFADALRPSWDWNGSWPPFATFALGLALAAAWSAKRRVTHAACRTQNLSPVALIHVPNERVRGTLTAPLYVGAVMFFEAAPVLAAISGILGVALSIDIEFSPAPAPDVADTSRPRLAATKPWYRRFWQNSSTAADAFDVTTLLGFGVCLGCYALLAWQRPYAPAAVSCSAWLSAPLFFTSTRRTRTHAPQREAAAAEASATLQPAFLRSSSTTVSSSLSSRATTSG